MIFTAKYKVGSRRWWLWLQNCKTTTSAELITPLFGYSRKHQIKGAPEAKSSSHHQNKQMKQSSAWTLKSMSVKMRSLSKDALGETAIDTADLGGSR